MGLPVTQPAASSSTLQVAYKTCLQLVCSCSQGDSPIFLLSLLGEVHYSGGATSKAAVGSDDAEKIPSHPS